MKPTLTALTLAITATLAAPALAGGTFTFGWTAKNAEEARAIRGGLAIYALAKDIDSNGHITQAGADNVAGILQDGAGNQAVVHQEGDGHVGTIAQHGDGNSCGLFQFGTGAEGHVEQNGNGEACLVFQAGF